MQLARHYGVHVTGVCSSDNSELVLDLGAERVIDHRSEDFSRSGQLYDVIINTVGNITLGRFGRATTAKGILLAVDGGEAVFVRTLASAVLWSLRWRQRWPSTQPDRKTVPCRAPFFA
ncbi:MAG: zinc-binding dehydrogenase [Candidatus Devosia symbiotica]|nr:zinc-binding dehydrogenase [Candidatus Devosia symbiotica]